MQSDRKKELTRQTILQAKQVFADMSDKEVIALFDAAGEQISSTTLRRIRTKGSEDMGYNYDLTIRPLAKVIRGISCPSGEQFNDGAENTEDKGISDATIQINNIEIDFLRSQVATLTSQVELQEKLLDERHDFIVHLGKEKDEVKEAYEAEVARLHKINRRQTIALIFALLLLLLAAGTDALIPWF